MFGPKNPHFLNNALLMLQKPIKVVIFAILLSLSLKIIFFWLKEVFFKSIDQFI